MGLLFSKKRREELEYRERMMNQIASEILADRKENSKKYELESGKLNKDLHGIDKQKLINGPEGDDSFGFFRKSKSGRDLYTGAEPKGLARMYGNVRKSLNNVRKSLLGGGTGLPKRDIQGGYWRDRLSSFFRGSIADLDKKSDLQSISVIPLSNEDSADHTVNVILPGKVGEEDEELGVNIALLKKTNRVSRHNNKRDQVLGTYKMDNDVSPTAERLKGAGSATVSTIQTVQPLQEIVVEDVGVDKNYVVTKDDRKMLRKVLQRHFLFSELDRIEQDSLIKTLGFKSLEPGDLVCQAGAKGTSCFIVRQGQFAVKVNDQEVAIIGPGHAFGELAMLYGVPRTATVAAKSTGNIFILSGPEFRLHLAALRQSTLHKHMDFLNKHPVFSRLTMKEKKAMAFAGTFQTFQPGETIMHENTGQDWIFIVESGRVTVTDQYLNQKVLGVGSILGGNQALARQVHKAVTVNHVTCLALGREGMERCIGSIESMLTMAIIRSMLETVWFFNALKLEQKNNMASAFEFHRLFPGEVLCSSGAKSQLILVMDGNINVVPQEKLGQYNQSNGFAESFRKPALPDPVRGQSPSQRTNMDVNSIALAIKKTISDAHIHGSRVGEPVVDEILMKTQSLPDNVMVPEPVAPSSVPDDPPKPELSLGDTGGSADLEKDINPPSPEGSCPFKRSLVRSESIHWAGQYRELTNGHTYGALTFHDQSPMPDNLIALKDSNIFRIGYDELCQALRAKAKKTPSLEYIIRRNRIENAMLSIELFKPLYEIMIDALLEEFETRKIKKGEVIMNQDLSFFMVEPKFDLLDETAKSWKKASPLESINETNDQPTEADDVPEHFGTDAILSLPLTVEEKKWTAPADCTLLELKMNKFSQLVGVFYEELRIHRKLKDYKLTLDMLESRVCIGRGNFGSVYCVKLKESNVSFAIKEVNKRRAIEYEQTKSTKNEATVLKMCCHPCLVRLVCTFQDAQSVYFLQELIMGGDLFTAIREIGMLSRNHQLFYGASICLALEYLHHRGITYRDLKPENILLTADGYVKLVDFGCITFSPCSYTLVGTPEYIAPEVILGKGYSHSVDWWSYGIIMYEFICGPLPFYSATGDQLELFQKILEAPLTFPSYVTDDESTSLLITLLERTPENRLGSSIIGAKEVQNHVFFAKFNFDAILNKSQMPPYVPTRLDPHDIRNAEEPLPYLECQPGDDLDWCKDF